MRSTYTSDHLIAPGAVTLVGFDSAWVDNPKAPGAICALHIGEGHTHGFFEPRLVGFDAAADLVNLWARDGVVLVALDKPTIVVNDTGARLVDRVAGSLIGWLGGGVQPAYRGKASMFGDHAPVWRFFAAIDAQHDPEAARHATSGCHVLEVFPALALPSLHTDFFGAKLGPRYNPARTKTYRLADWTRVIEVATLEAARWSCEPLSQWLLDLAQVESPRKADQDRLDAAICLLIGLRWRFGDRAESVLLGDTKTGFILAPVTPAAHARLADKARQLGVPVDGIA
jgi:predicted RNase H-like nuclease